jgi:uncharacterized membrane protein
MTTIKAAAKTNAGTGTSTKAANREIRNWHASQKQHLTQGERAADRMRNFMGSWRFVGGFVAFMLVWAALNLSLPLAWDKYPFILLNLFLSMLAGLQGAILLIAAKRQDAIAAALAEHDYTTNVAAKTDIEALMKINQEQIVMLKELCEIIQVLKTDVKPAAKPVSKAAAQAS